MWTKSPAELSWCQEHTLCWWPWRVRGEECRTKLRKSPSSCTHWMGATPKTLVSSSLVKQSSIFPKATIYRWNCLKAGRKIRNERKYLRGLERCSKSSWAHPTTISACFVSFFCYLNIILMSARLNYPLDQFMPLRLSAIIILNEHNYHPVFT